MDHTRAFRDYATRVSFNISMSRNQVAVFRAIVLDLERPPFVMKTLEGPGIKIGIATKLYGDERRALGIPDARMIGIRWLIANGFVREQPEITAMRLAHEKGEKWDWKVFDKHDHQYILTPAGEHMAELLRLAGLIPERATNQNAKPRRKRRA